MGQRQGKYKRRQRGGSDGYNEDCAKTMADLPEDVLNVGLQ